MVIGTVPVYDSVIHYQRDLATLTAKDFIDAVRLHAEKNNCDNINIVLFNIEEKVCTSKWILTF